MNASQQIKLLELAATKLVLERDQESGLVRRPYRDFVEQHNKSLLHFEHIEHWISVAQRVADREIKRLMVLSAPRYLKTTVFTKMLAPHFMRKHAGSQVMLACHAASLAWSLSVEARDYFEVDGGVLSRTEAGKGFWRASTNSRMGAAGAGAGRLGFGYDLGILDDLVDPERAQSLAWKRKFRDWWPAHFLSRQEPDASIVVVMQRLGVEDLIDFLLRREVGDDEDEAPEYWHVLLGDEIKSDDPLGPYDGELGLPPTCTLLRDDREDGDLLAPSRFNAKQVEMLRRTAGPLVASAQRQQRPTRPEGDFWKAEWFRDRVYDVLPSDAYDGGTDWDTAYTAKEANAASAYVRSFRGPGEPHQFPIYIDEVDWDWRKFPDLVDWMESTAGPHFVEAKASGKSTVQALESAGVAAKEVAVLGDKLARASSVQNAVANRRIWINRRVRDSLLMGQGQGLLNITAELLQLDASMLDLNDAFVQALCRHLGIFEKRKRKARFG